MCLAIWANAFVPAIARAAAARDLPLVVAELCSARGTGTVPIWPSTRQATDGTSNDGPAQRGGPAAGHCAACPTPADPAGLPAVQATAFLPAPSVRPLPAFTSAPAVPPLAWPPAHPRAPPTPHG